MSKVNATYSGFVSHEGVPVLLSAGDEFEADHPLVAARPDLFTKPPAPKQQQKEDPKPPEVTQPPAPAKRGPGRPPGSKTKAKDADG